MKTLRSTRTIAAKITQRCRMNRQRAKENGILRTSGPATVVTPRPDTKTFKVNKAANGQQD